MNRKTVTAILLGLLAAALVCVIAGIIMYFCAKSNAILLLVGLFAIFMGSFMAIVPLIILIVNLITAKISKKNK